MRQDSIVSNISIFSDPHNAPILQTISAARLRDRRPDYLHFRKHHQPRTIPRPALPHTPLMNALFVLRPAKLWAFNIGHPCPSLAKGSWLAARLACFKYYYYSRHPQRPNLANHICRKTEGSPPRLSPLPQTPPTPHYPSPHTPLGSLVKGSWLAARLASFKYYYYSRHPQRPNLANHICRKTEGSPPRLSPLPQTPPTPHYPPPRTATHSAYERSVCFASCKTLGVKYRASLPVPCQRELACGKARLFQILLLFATPTTPQSCKPYLPQD